MAQQPDSRLTLLEAIVAAVEQHALIARIVGADTSDDEMRAQLAAPPLNFSDNQTRAVLELPIRSLRPDYVAQLRSEIVNERARVARANPSQPGDPAIP